MENCGYAKNKQGIKHGKFSEKVYNVNESDKFDYDYTVASSAKTTIQVDACLTEWEFMYSRFWWVMSWIRFQQVHTSKLNGC